MKRITSYVLCGIMLLGLSLTGTAQSTIANYELASRFSPEKVRKMVFSTSVDAHWMQHSDRFWYTYETPNGKQWYIVDPAARSKSPLFDVDKMAAEVTKIVKDPFDGQNLPIQNLKFVDRDRAIMFEIKSTVDVVKKDRKDKKAADSLEKKTFIFHYDLQTQQLKELIDFEKPKARPSWANIAPDSSAVVFAREYNLYWMSKADFLKALKDDKDTTIVEHQLTTDGEENYGYGNYRERDDLESDKKKKERKGVNVLWSPDAKYFATLRTDARNVKDLWVIHNTSNPRPTLETYKYHMPGEKEAFQRELILVNFAKKEVSKMSTSAFKDQELTLWPAPRLEKDRDLDFRPMLWTGNNRFFYFARTSRDLKRVDICRVEAATGKVDVLIEERFNTYIEFNRPTLVNDGKELIHWSERDGWGHFYLYDDKGKLIRQLTSGPWHTSQVEGVDEKARVMYFTANGREKGEDPYYEHLYRVNLDGTNLKVLNPGNFSHSTSLNDNQRFFVNNYSRVNAVPKSELFDTNGRKIMDLEETDVSKLLEAGYKFPEPFNVKADDGRTDLYGVMYKPFDFDSTKSYPLILYVYPGPQTEAVNKTFSLGMDRTDRLAQVGFIVVTVGNRGGHPNRSKWYHNYGYGNLRDYGLADKKATVEQLSARHSFIDASRVGIHGHSGGGFMSTAALLVYPEVFHAAASSAGNHENNIYNRWWSEKHHGVQELVTAKGDTTFKYQVDKNPDLAKYLKGRLLLSTGDVDNNVHPAGTIRMAEALIKANKRFDFALLPGQRHGYGNMSEYYFWMMADHFSKALLNDTSLRTVDIMEMNREKPNKR